ncbi:MAG: hypothetical protein NWT12_11715 [Paracoccaceae bacterium]|jgi:hypothetical protein|nr:hypothetical protein [Paracoccaceae bacterium]MDP5366944.1 hypothetical protein [Paracoccaceae bacterium]
MQHSRHLAPSGAQALTQPGVSARHARLFEMIRQQDLSRRALERLHHRQADDLSLPSPGALASTLYDGGPQVTG